MEYAEAQPEATPIQAEAPLHLGDQAAVARALATPSELWDDPIVPNRASAASWLGLTTQNTVRSVYLTSGSDRLLHFGTHRVELRHAPAWQLLVPYRTAGVCIRALAWLGPNEIDERLDTRGHMADDLQVGNTVPPFLRQQVAARVWEVIERFNRSPDQTPEGSTKGERAQPQATRVSVPEMVGTT